MKQRNKSQKGIWRRFFEMLHASHLPYVLMIAAFACNAAASYINLKMPDYVATLVDGVEQKTLLIIFWFGMGNILLSVAAILTKNVAQAIINRNMQLLSVDKIFYLRMEEIEHSDPREMVTRITTDTTLLSGLMLTLVIDELPRIYYMIGALIKVFRNYNTTLGWIMLLSIPVTIIGSIIMGRLTFGRADAAQGAISRLTARLAEKINNMPIIKSYNNQQKESDSGEGVIKELEVALRRKALVSRLSAAMTSLVTLIPTVGVIAIGATMVLSGSVERTAFVAYYVLAGNFIGYVVAHLALWVQVKEAQGATNRLSAILEQPDERPGEKRVGGVGDIEFVGVTKSFGDHTVLDNVSFTIERGKKTAFVGYSGSGKSTALNLIEQFYYPENGEIRMGGKPISAYDIRSFRSLFTYVPQNAPGFSGSIRDLLCYGMTERPSDETLWDALEKTEADAFVKLLGGLEYDIGNNAGKLSGGQKQKLCMARALLNPQEIMLLDEATSALDVRATNRIQTLLDAKMAGKTMVVVAHNISTVKNADKIIVFSDGHVVDEGRHEELLQRCKLYQELAAVA
ncbi:MAG: ABC transporter ATP-binding protein [Clostridia bacterium]|nr:ABC transporter ATP-binding protein [Clostridia bacterium]